MRRVKFINFNFYFMQEYKKKFVEFLVRANVLKFGDFTLKSGRKCPYFLNFGDVYSGESVSELGYSYAQALSEYFTDYDTILGPAYKGIPIATATAIVLFRQFEINKNYAYNRKEAKDHGEGGMFVGAKINADSKLVILDDVMTAGTALRETLSLLDGVGNPHVVGVLIAVDRMERGKGDKSAIKEVKDEFDIDVYSIVNLKEIVEYLSTTPVHGEIVLDEEKVSAINNYLAEYGVN